MSGRWLDARVVLLVAALATACSSPGRAAGDDAGARVDAAAGDDAAAADGDGGGADAGGEEEVASKSCAALPDGTPCDAAPDDCHEPAACQGGACVPGATRADGFAWMPGDDTARCCGGKPVHTTTAGNCGVCGIQCNASNGESCQVFEGEWFCRGCEASSGCWSHCCSESFSPFSCAASDCNGNCSDALCPAGAHCVVGTDTSNYCSY